MDKKTAFPPILFLAASLVFQKFSAGVPVLCIFVLHFIYYLFYTRRPSQFWLFYILGFFTGGYVWYSGSNSLLYLYGAIALGECLRVHFMAILRYPSTIKDLQLLTEELEKRVERRTSELRISNERLSRANEELKKLDEMKSAFVSQASHDLRTPLAAIKGSLDNLILGVAGETTEKQRRVLNRAAKSVDRLSRLIDDILDLNRIESGRTSLEKRCVVLFDILRNSVQENRPAAGHKQIAISLQCQDRETKIHADPGKLERVFAELIGNAIKYTPEGGRVEILCQRDGGYMAVCVSDTGIGMSGDECRRVWDRFYRTHASQKFAKGTGLGLSIAKELVEMHRGTIEAESEPGKGTRFVVRLPLPRFGEGRAETARPGAEGTGKENTASV